MIVSELLDLAQRFFGLKDIFTKARRDRRDRIATYFEQVGTTLVAVADSLRRGEVPHGKCQEMLVYSQTLPATIGDEVGSDKAQDYALQLARAHEVEQLLSQLGSGNNRDQQLADLDRASGLFQALAASIRAAP